uniref:EMG1/NEP1 methyltransferase n=1 Tax=Trypanosoma congolense (strain IL3000) TaxID=1068625 RepID=G0US94_TRYCI|nr:conserved hypothetical protein [Trypanosoma congolense IL3000]
MEYRQKSARLPRSAEEKNRWRRVIIILEHCPLAVVRGEYGFELLAERHRAHHSRNKQDPAEWRPDVVHQALLHLMDSPLNRAGMLQVFLRTKKGVVIAVDPRLRVPRHMRLFEKMMVSCLYRMKVRASNGSLSLLRVVRNPVTDHIPANCKLIRVEKDGDAVPDIFAYCAACGVDGNIDSLMNDRGGTGSCDALAGAASKKDATSTHFAQKHRDLADGKRFRPFAFIIGGMAKGDVDVPYAPRAEVQSIRLSDRGMSAAAACSIIVHAFEDTWLREDNESC